jgi:IrrE N-terminal-like domain
MTEPVYPQRWANDLTILLNAVLGQDRFPVNVPEVAQEFSRKRFPDDPITVVRGSVLPGFDGALARAPAGKTGWGIFYNTAIASSGRINFTLAHEFGHYLMHRQAYPNGIRCGDQDVVRWDSEYGQIEHQANVFSATLLMPLDDFRRQVPERIKADLDTMSGCAERYRVSLIAALLRWLEYTECRAVLVVSRDGYILWSRSSHRALKTRAFFRTSSGPIEIPAGSLAGRQDRLVDGRIGVEVPPGVWFPEQVREMTVFADQYDFALTLLLLDDNYQPSWHDEPVFEDTYARFVPAQYKR